MLNPPNIRKILQNLTCVTTNEECRLALWAPCKSSDLDPISTRLVKDCLDILITPITSIITLSFTEDSFPLYFKSAHISPPPPLWRNPPSIRIAWTITGNSKVLGEVFVNQVTQNTSNHCQSAYRKFHSTETALLKIHDNIPASMDAGKVTALTLLDLSATFDTIDHTVLLRRIVDWFGVTGKAFDWFKSYLSSRWQIRLDDCLSTKADLKFGVPRGSVLGLLLFTLYTTPLSSMIYEHALLHNLYADNNQLYVLLCIRVLCCGTEWFTVMFGLE